MRQSQTLHPHPAFLSGTLPFYLLRLAHSYFKKPLFFFNAFVLLFFCHPALVRRHQPSVVPCPDSGSPGSFSPVFLTAMWSAAVPGERRRHIPAVLFCPLALSFKYGPYALDTRPEVRLHPPTSVLLRAWPHPALEGPDPS